MAKKRFSVGERLRFHERRVYAPSEFSCSADSGKVAYSDGFVKGFHNDKSSVKSSYWKSKKKSRSYGIGYKRGLSARKKFKGFGSKK